ncbi:NAD(P)-dependent dehydrogenase (short-subunit alcohol dehydrogenase family) [Mesorhizobium loti]|uniref:NAD(P)-dependent dehydrogenase (Short-subunit alcohol dehydrogenase family) n=1 Tax=Rhizobium loti TaxID=381 RepID=A0A8E2W653_RHILI|nr:SDR family oxidoreductase [Mesorhizobium loti]PWJ86908.1 NAD(P)-dependent dehydrogenase (short-subunit alcohol dehydrogenase family) [Mesorhizobium loti]
MIASRVCLITGASGRLGAKFCELFRKEYKIAAVYHENIPLLPSQHTEIFDPCKQMSGAGDPDSLFVIKADLFDSAQIDRVVELTLARFGRIDLLINNAVFSHWGSAVDDRMLVDCAMQQFEMNVVVPLRLSVKIASEFWRDKLQENREANRNVINVSSSSGVYIYQNSKQGVYSASKAALNYMSCHLANEFHAFGVRVNAVAPNAFPGIVATEDVARLLNRIDSEAVTGQIVVFDADGELMYSP